MGESNEMNFDDVLLELQILGFDIKENTPNKKYTANKSGEFNIKIDNIGSNSLSVSTSRDSHKEKTKYTYTEFIDDLVVNSI